MNTRMCTTAAIAIAAAFIGGAATAQTIVKVLRVETNNAEKAIYNQAVTDYEKAHPGVTIKMEYLANEAFKQKLPTLLQSDGRPDLFYSWGGGVLRAEDQAGLVANITDEASKTWNQTYSAAGVKAFTVKGKIVGAPINASEVVFWTNLTLAKKAGIDITKIKTWDEFLAAVKKAKAAGVTPIMVGGRDKWPLMFYYGYLAVREAGQQGFADAMAGKDGGFASKAFVEAASQFKRLIDLKPFEPGFIGVTAEQASGRFGDGQAVFHLMGDWDYQNAKDLSKSGKGIPDKDLGLLRFPTVAGGQGRASDTFGGINGWVVAKGAPKQAVDFLAYLNSEKIQAEEAAKGIFIPTAIGASASIKNPFFKTMAEDLSASKFHQIFLDQDLGPDVGATFNDVSAELAQGAITPTEAAKQVQSAWTNR